MTRLADWAQRTKPAARARTHLLAAALLWTLVGTGLLCGAWELWRSWRSFGPTG